MPSKKVKGSAGSSRKQSMDESKKTKKAKKPPEYVPVVGDKVASYARPAPST